MESTTLVTRQDGEASAVGDVIGVGKTGRLVRRHGESSISPVTATGSQSLDGAKPRLEIGEDVLDRLEPDAEPNQIRGDARRQLFGLAQL